MNKITEIIPDDIPEWAIKSMAAGQFYRDAIARTQLECPICAKRKAQHAARMKRYRVKLKDNYNKAD